MDGSINNLVNSTFQSTNLGISKVDEGVSTNVYKIVKGNDTFYLRMSHESDEMMSPQVLAHDLLSEAGVKVPEIIAWSDETDEVGFPYMVVRETPGVSLERLRSTDIKSYDACIQEIMSDAGADIARTTSIRLEKFGWIDRENKNATKLTGNSQTYPDFLLHRFQTSVNELKNLFGFETYNPDEVEVYKSLVMKYLIDSTPNLVHGDFSLPHIYVDKGKYSGIIDWGDIRSAGSLYDIAHFSAYEPNLLNLIMKGFNSIVPSNKSDEQILVLTRISISVRKLLWIAKNIPKNFENHPFKDVILEDLVYLNNLTSA